MSNITEIKLPNDFNWKTYLELNPDLDKTTTEYEIRKHYIKYGIREKRQYKYGHTIPDDFNWLDYVNLNNDLSYIKTKDEAIRHYLNHGITENRNYKFTNITNLKYDYKYYINNDDHFYPKMTVIVPNYNNAKYLKKRLDSIYNQTIYPDEIIIIDDCSTDNSVEIINCYIKDKIIPTTFIINKVNSGSGYYNWINGIKMAKNELIWIAESDDYCDDNFIEVLSKEFIDKSVSISYCRTYFVNEIGDIIWTMVKYLDNSWNNNIKKTCNELVKDKFGYLNIIPNVSSCIFKKPSNYVLNIIEDFLNKNIKLVLDWVFYLLISKNSSISYLNNVNNYYLVRNNSISKNIQQTEQFFIEHNFIMEFIIDNFNINVNSITLLFNLLKKHCTELKLPLNYLTNNYKNKHLINKVNNTKITVMIFSYAFDIGGGEIFPIHLANSLYKKSINVIFMVNDFNNVNNNIYKLLNKHIKIVNNVSNINKIINDFGVTHVNTHHQCCDSIILNYSLNNPNKVTHIITDHGMYNIDNKEKTHLINLIKKTRPLVVYINNLNKKNFDNINILKYNIPISIENYKDYNKIDRNTYGLSNTDFVITLASRCIIEKGWREMIDIINKINITHKNVKLLLIGDYNNEFGLELKKTCNNPNIYFLGYKKHIKRFYEISNIGILPTYYKCESNPIVLIECLYSHKPFIVTNIGETPNMLFGEKDYAGTLIDLKDQKIDIDKYVFEIMRYVNDNEYYNNKIKETFFAVNNFSMKSIADKYIEIFNN